MITQTTELMQLRLGQDGYAFAKIDPVPKENAETKEIELTFSSIRAIAPTCAT